eukprot:scaffold228332_cov18-Tisochrysis_lutea.AAC.1
MISGHGQQRGHGSSCQCTANWSYAASTSFLVRNTTSAAENWCCWCHTHAMAMQHWCSLKPVNSGVLACYQLMDTTRNMLQKNKLKWPVILRAQLVSNQAQEYAGFKQPTCLSRHMQSLSEHSVLTGAIANVCCHQIKQILAHQPNETDAAAH